MSNRVLEGHVSHKDSLGEYSSEPLSCTSLALRLGTDVMLLYTHTAQCIH